MKMENRIDKLNCPYINNNYYKTILIQVPNKINTI